MTRGAAAMGLGMMLICSAGCGGDEPPSGPPDASEYDAAGPSDAGPSDASPIDARADAALAPDAGPCPGELLPDGAGGCGRWTAGPSPLGHHEFHTATVLADGRILFHGGEAAPPEVFEPATGEFAAVAPSGSTPEGHTATLLPDGRVLFVGGLVEAQARTGGEIYDPVSDSWTPIAPMATGRRQHVAALLPDGKVLVAGGLVNVFGPREATASVEIYDPELDAWTPAGELSAARAFAVALGLGGAGVLVAGGEGNSVFADESSRVDRFDPSTGMWAEEPLLAEGRVAPLDTVLPDGRLWIGMGYGHYLAALGEIRATDSGVWSSTASPTDTPLDYALAAIAPLGGTTLHLACGGSPTTIDPAQYWKADCFLVLEDGAIVDAPPMLERRVGHTATPLADGRVLVVGSAERSDRELSYETELYERFP